MIVSFCLLSGPQVNTVLLDCLMYEDDRLFEKAIAAMSRDFGQRRKLLDVTDAVTLVHQASLPVFDNVATLQSELSYLIFIMRSSEVWGVKSRVSGEFDLTRKDQALETARKLLEFMHTDTFVVGKPIPKGAAVGTSLDKVRVRVTRWCMHVCVCGVCVCVCLCVCVCTRVRD